MPKKREVASLVGNFSPVKRSRVIFVSNLRHLSGDMGEELNSRADTLLVSVTRGDVRSTAHPLETPQSCRPSRWPAQHLRLSFHNSWLRRGFRPAIAAGCVRVRLCESGD
jgi:hypothetical protein